jgi:outer membrane biosynthesis protein TonB
LTDSATPSILIDKSIIKTYYQQATSSVPDVTRQRETEAAHLKRVLPLSFVGVIALHVAMLPLLIFLEGPAIETTLAEEIEIIADEQPEPEPAENAPIGKDAGGNGGATEQFALPSPNPAPPSSDSVEVAAAPAVPPPEQVKSPPVKEPEISDEVPIPEPIPTPTPEPSPSPTPTPETPIPTPRSCRISACGNSHP